MKRRVIVVSVLMLAAAPTRAWCEAACVTGTATDVRAPSHAHCKTAGGQANVAVSGAGARPCPQAHAERPVVPAREWSRVDVRRLAPPVTPRGAQRPAPPGRCVVGVLRACRAGTPGLPAPVSSPAPLRI